MLSLLAQHESDLLRGILWLLVLLGVEAPTLLQHQISICEVPSTDSQ